ncbi:MAG: class I SAM-dependent methyltransferase [Proteobacteria bacterium]|nr:class I SAM-dependent methyltransferase [Pseudomonadota bacterium]
MKFKESVREILAPHISPRLAARAMQRRQQWKFSKLYGDFHIDEDFRAIAVSGLPNESRGISGEIVNIVIKLRGPAKTVLLPGESNYVKTAWADLLGLDEDSIITAGLAEHVDFKWNFEESPPSSLESVDCIVSQAILEHLIDPYKHVRDCWNLLNDNGHLILHTVIPGFHYHRYPIDCLRFFPDWFEEVAKRMEAEVVYKYIGFSRIVYQLRKPI